MNTQRVFFLLRRWWLILVVGTLLATGASYVVSKAQPKVYEATALLQVNPGLPDVGGGGNFSEYQAAWTLATQDARLLQTTEVAQATLASTSRQLSHPLDAATLLKNTKATPLPQQALVTLAVRTSDPNDAQLLANTMANTFVQSDTLKRHADAPYLEYLNRQIRYRRTDEAAATQEEYQLQQKKTPSQAQLQRIGVLIERIADDGARIGELQNAIQSIDLRLAGTGSTASIADVAQKPSSAIAPRTAINVLVAAVLALLALLGIALLTDALDTSPRTPEDVAIRLNLPLLATISSAIPSSPALITKDENLSSTADEYRILEMNLRFATGIEEQMRPGHALTIGGTNSATVAANFAITAARAGLDVILVDANLRRPTVQALFDLPQRTGLTSLLRADSDPLSLLQDTTDPNLRVLTAGNAPTEAIDLLWSARMRRALAALRDATDLVILNAPEVHYPDIAALSTLSDTTLLVADMRNDSRSTLTTGVERLLSCNVALVGVVVVLSPVQRILQHAIPLTLRKKLEGLWGSLYQGAK